MESLRFAGFASALSLSLVVAACAQSAQESSTAQGQQGLSTSDGGSGGHPHDGRHHGPPPAAFDACTSKATGDACTVSFDDKQINGKCAAPPPDAEDKRSFCAPEGGPGGPHGRPHGPPPAEAFAACDGKTEGASCDVAFDGGTRSGNCIVPPSDSGEKRLVCAPPRGPGRGPGHP
ncbi:hypothetical protein AKJ09_11162 [Labilithrix luteola]|uniref:Lipoprotein n=1 Tax=Labilithrix luteola TaxID=1391654 RepID=A0A0K1QFG0_9BACT|nr:hypothetical protein [Labilithrix luteola]AKV04499.1 hypothetical protein AKJ09_11162 [Labilithrix luteola]